MLRKNISNFILKLLIVKCFKVFFTFLVSEFVEFLSGESSKTCQKFIRSYSATVKNSSTNSVVGRETNY